MVIQESVSCYGHSSGDLNHEPAQVDMRTFDSQPNEYGQVPEVSHADRVRAALRMRSWQLKTYAQAAGQLNAAGILTATGKQWTAGNLRAYTRRHGIPRHECLDHPPPLWDGSPERALENTPSYEAIVRCIEHGSLAQHAALRQRIRREPAVRTLVRRVSEDNLNHPYDAFSYGFWFQYAKHA